MALPPIVLTTETGASITLQPEIPTSWATRMDLGAEAAVLHRQTEPWPVQMRLLMAILGCTCAGQRNPANPRDPSYIPAYTGAGDLRTYGGSVIEVVVGRWRVAPSKESFRQILALLGDICDTLPTEEGVRRAEDFTGATAESSPDGSA